MKYFFSANTWGVTAQWLRQFSQRLVHHCGSFTGEACVHASAAKRNGDTGVVPDEARQKLKDTWLRWRIVVRVHQHESILGHHMPAATVNLLEDTEVLLEQIGAWYQEFMLKRRIAQYGKSVEVLKTVANHHLCCAMCQVSIYDL